MRSLDIFLGHIDSASINGYVLMIQHIGAAELIQLLIENLVVEVSYHTLHTAVEESLTHDVQLLAERVEDDDVVLRVEVGIALVVVALGERVVHYLEEAVVGEEVGNDVLETARVGFLAVGEAAVQTLVECDVVVAIDTHNLLDDVALTIYINFAGGDLEEHTVLLLTHDLDVEGGEGGADYVDGDLLADEVEDTLEVDFDVCAVDLVGIDVDHVAADIAASDLLDELDSPLQSPDGDIGVASTFETEGGVGLDTVTLAGLADGDGVEIGALEEDVGGLHGDAALFATEDAGNAHRLVSVADHKVFLVEFAFDTVEGHERSASGESLYYDLVAVDLVGVKSVHRLTDFHEDVVGDVDDIVYRTDADGAETVLQPVGRFCHLDAAEGDASITRTEVGLFDGYAYSTLGGLGDERCGHRRNLEFETGSVSSVQHRHHITRHTDMAGCIAAVGRDGDLEDIVLLDMEILLCGHSHRSVVREHHDASMVAAQLELVGSTEHTLAHGTAEFAFLYLEEFGFGSVDLGADLSADHLLAGGHVGSTTDDIQRTVATHVDGG